MAPSLSLLKMGKGLPFELWRERMSENGESSRGGGDHRVPGFRARRGGQRKGTEGTVVIFGRACGDLQEGKCARKEMTSG